MTVDLNSLAHSDSGLNLQDLVSAPNIAEMPISNEASTNVLAAHAALLSSPDEAVSTFKTVKDEVGLNNPSPKLAQVLDDANQREVEMEKREFSEIISDESLPVEDRVFYATQWRTGMIDPSRQRSPQELVQTQQLEADSAIKDNAEVDNSRFNIAGSLREVNRYNAEVQKMINDMDIQQDETKLGKVKDFAELFVPFSESARIYGVNKDMRKLLQEGDDASGQAKAFVDAFALPGESKEEMRARIAALPVEKRLPLAKAVYELITQHNDIPLAGDNHLMLMQNLREILVEGEYGTSSRIVDDVSGLLDAVGVGAALRVVSKPFRSMAKAAKVTGRVPVAAGEAVAQVNTRSANNLAEAVVKDETGEIAKNVFGTSREDAIKNTLGVEIGNEDGVVRMKPLIEDDQFDPNMDILKDVTDPYGSIQFSDAEKASKLNQVVSDFNTWDKTGLANRKEMTTISAVDDGIHIRTVVGPADGGFTTGATALNQVKWATSKYGVIDEELTLMKRGKDGNYKAIEPTSKEANLKGDYLVGINHTSQFDPSDKLSWAMTDVADKFGLKLNLFDRIPFFGKMKGGSITQHLLDPQTYIDPLLTRSASVSSDRIAYAADLLHGLNGNYAAEFKKLGSQEQAMFQEYLIKANHEGLKFDPVKLRAEGWSDQMMTTARKWKEITDTHFQLENLSVVRKAKRKGFELFLDRKNKTTHIVKPLENSAVGNLKVKKVYDSEKGVIRDITADERTELYKNNGKIGRARTAIEVDGEKTLYMIVKNDPNNYTRKLRDSDQLLNYRDGYYPIFYKDPIFIVGTDKTADGEEFTKAIATAKNIEDAQAYLRRLEETDPDWTPNKYTYRTDRMMQDFDEADWEARVVSGRTTQRLRGKLLDDATRRPQDPEFRHIASPEEALNRSAESLAKHIVGVEWIDTAKARFMKQYKNYLPLNPETHTIYFPDDVTQLRRPGIEGDASDFSDAVSTYRYIDQMENGFANLVDDISKGLFKTMADTAGKKGWSHLENVGRAGQVVSPVNFAKRKAFRLFLASAPLRQVFVQSFQAVPTMIATNPTFITKAPWQLYFVRNLDMGGDAETFLKAYSNKLTGLSETEARELAKAYKESGISSAVSAHTLMREQFKGLVNPGVWNKTKSLIAKPLDLGQKYGFEAGENLLMKTVWLSEYNKATKGGKVLNKADLAKLHARTRDLTLNMNKAGELAYNENSLSAILQFMQAPHKAFTQLLIGNRNLTKADRAKLTTTYVLTYGTGFGFLYDQANKFINPEDRATQELVSGGLLNYSVNKALSTLYGDDVDIDVSSSARVLEIPNPNVFKFFTELSGMTLGDVVAKGPSLGLVAENNGKVYQFARTLTDFFRPAEEVSFTDVAHAYGDMFSGMSAVFKARLAFARGKSYRPNADVLDDNVNQMESFMKLFGFNTVDEMLTYKYDEESYIKGKAFKEDVKTWFDNASRRLSRQGMTTDEINYTLTISRLAWDAFPDTPEARNVVQQELRRRAKNGDFVIYQRLMDQAKWMDEGKFNEMLSKSPMDENQRTKLKEFFNAINKDSDNGG